MDDDKDVESLYTGLRDPQQIFGNEDLTEGVKAAKLKQKEQAAALTPLEMDIREYIAEEKRAVGDVRSYLAVSHKPDEIKDEFRAREIYLTYLERFESWMQTRLNKKQQVK